MKRVNLKKLNMWKLQNSISNRFAALRNLNDNVEISVSLVKILKRVPEC
jgi:hypothetical protein